MGFSFFNHPLFAPALLAIVAVAVGSLIPFYVSVLNDGWIALALLPLAVVVCGLFFADRKKLLLLILLTRAVMEVWLESTRGGGMGLGAVINVAVILIALALVIETPVALDRSALWAWLPFFSAAALGLLLSPDKGHAVRLCLTWATNLCIFASAFFIVQKQEDFRLALRVIVWSSLLPTIYGLAQVVALGGALGPDGRLQSTFTHPNIYAYYLVLVIWVCLILLKRANSINQGSATARVGVTVYLALLLVQLVLTQTRAAWLACFALFVAYTLRFERRYLIYILMLVPLALLLPIVQDRLHDLSSNNLLSHYGKLDSWSWRIELWSAAFGSFEWHRLVTGYGIGAFRENAPVFFSRSGGVNWDAHNVYVQWFYDVGLIGLTTYFWLHYRLLRQLQLLHERDHRTAFMILAIVIGYLIISVSDNMMYYLVFNWYYWFLVGAACALASLPPSASLSSLTRGVRR
ncbi:MAG: hypothetical protein JWR21_3685 [Herminiimonas sp.]|nr:hypothetical protein [Herminiimonas sp.]